MFKVGDHVRVLPKKPNGEDHPMAGTEGVVRETLGVLLTGPGWAARAMVRPLFLAYKPTRVIAALYPSRLKLVESFHVNSRHVVTFPNDSYLFKRRPSKQLLGSLC